MGEDVVEVLDQVTHDRQGTATIRMTTHMEVPIAMVYVVRKVEIRIETEIETETEMKTAITVVVEIAAAVVIAHRIGSEATILAVLAPAVALSRKNLGWVRQSRRDIAKRGAGTVALFLEFVLMEPSTFTTTMENMRNAFKISMSV
jgi:hypothetical protein